MKKPPLGLFPRKFHDENRALNILHAMHRYIIAGKVIPMAWFIELKDLSVMEVLKK